MCVFCLNPPCASRRNADISQRVSALIKACQPRCREAKQEPKALGVPRVSLSVPCSGGQRWNRMRDTHHNLTFVELWVFFCTVVLNNLLQSFPRVRLPPDFAFLIPGNSIADHTALTPLRSLTFLTNFLLKINQFLCCSKAEGWPQKNASCQYFEPFMNCIIKWWQ